MTRAQAGRAAMPGRLEFIDFAKGLAILGIVVFHFLRGHFQGWAGLAVTAGGSGVHLFLILSGFGLGLSGKGLPGPLAFYRRRAGKILVPYIISITLVFMVNQWVSIYPGRGWYDYLGHVLLFKMFDETIVNSFGGHFWFLSTLVQFYLAYPLLAAAQNRMQPMVFFLAALAVSLAYGTCVAAFGKAGLKVYNGFFLLYLWEFCAGMALARRFRETGEAFWRLPVKHLAAGGAAAMAVTAFLAMKAGPIGKLFNDFPSAVWISCFAAAAYSVLDTRARALKRAVLSIGNVSYELYLTHMLAWGLAAAWWGSITASPPTLPFRLLAVAAACAAAWGYRRMLQLARLSN